MEDLIGDAWIVKAEVNHTKWDRFFCTEQEANAFAEGLRKEYSEPWRLCSVEVRKITEDDVPEILHDDHPFPIWDRCTGMFVYVNPQALLIGDVVVASMNNVIVAFNISEQPDQENWGIFATDLFLGEKPSTPKMVFYSPKKNRFVEDDAYVNGFYMGMGE